MNFYYKLEGKFSKPLTAEQLKDLLDTFRNQGGSPYIEAEGLCIVGAMSYSTACKIVELLKEFSVRQCIGGAFVTHCYGEQHEWFLGPEPLALAAEEQRLTEKVKSRQARLDEVQKLISRYSPV